MKYLPFKPIKGQEFVLYFSSTADQGIPGSLASGWDYFGISKDGAQFTETSNSPTEIAADASSATGTRANCFVTLTATEMDADAIIIAGYDTGGGSAIGSFCMVIYTQVSELAAAPTLNSSLSDKLTAIFQYLFFQRTNTASVQTLYKNNSSTTIGTATITDDSTTVTRGKIG